MKRLNPLNDFLFKKLFGEEKDKDLLIGFLNAILNSDIVNLTIENENLHRTTEEDKLGILDIKAKTITGEKFNVEVQLVNQKNMIPRTLFYWSKLFVEDFESGSNYKQLQKTVAINILGFKLEELRYESFHSIFKLREVSSNQLLTDLIEIHFIDFPKFEEENYNLKNPLHRWLLFLKEDIPQDQLREVVNMDSILNKAEEKLMKLSADPETRREYELRAKALSDERSRMEDAKEEGMEKGIAQGIEKGIAKGIEKGITQGVLKVVQSFLDSGMPLSEVAKHTPYTEEELEAMLKKKE
ncbi:Rpn family recombination-promoting nuclease/putative transposase [Neobacillus sp. PS3-34]|uniref:Rpn family recombination-promoting nuclease/putative transposase n=1 Tax=Neobacillus sp. PS3-34 TaxID=3070678 RepID=UPI0027DFB3BB|nr:Rpn family recombination-promoting nuclease/putative transposase [Neobacillus sp. PS3-34]WML46881.1 Rpn family recombination-promoting nuclease/putative transposase [Neobacillus sp. PS3-34]